MQVLSPVRQLPCRLYDVHWLISKKAGKFIVAYAGAYSQGTYYIASVADKVIANPREV